MKKYNVKEIMNIAHNFRKAEGVTMGEALKAAWSVARIKIGASPLDETAQELFIVRAEKAKIIAREKELENKIRAKCMESPDYKISGYGWAASVTVYTRHDLDNKALKADHADLYAAYTKAKTVERFNFGSVAI